MPETEKFPMTDGRENAGLHATGGVPGNNNNALNEGMSREKSPDMLLDRYDRRIVKMGFSLSPLNAIMRSVPAKKTKSMRFGFFSIDLRQDNSTMTAAYTISSAEEARGEDGTNSQVIHVANAKIFDVTDQVSFKGVNGWVQTKSGTLKELVGMTLNALVRKANYEENTITVQFINGKENITIPEGTVVYQLGHAAAELDASTVPYSAVPTKTEQFMQKFMTQTLVGNILKESDKNVDYNEGDVDEMVLQQLLVDIEKSYIFGAKGYSWDNDKRQFTYTCSGLIEQMLVGGSPMVHVNKSDWDSAAMVRTVSNFFIGNSGSTTRYMFSGNGFSTAMYTLEDVVRYQNANDTETKLEYEWRRIRVANFVLKNIAHPLFDMRSDMTNCAMILDKQYLEIHKFRSLEDTELALKESGALDASSKVLCEISAPCLKYPKCHGMIFLD